MHRSLIQATPVKLLKTCSTQTHKVQEKQPLFPDLTRGKASNHGADVKGEEQKEIKGTERKPRCTSCGWRVQGITHKLILRNFFSNLQFPWELRTMVVSKDYLKLIEDFNPLGNTFHCFKVLIYVHFICISLTAMFRPNFDDNNGRTIDGQWWVNSYFF